MTESTRSEPLLQHPQANCQLVLDGQDIGYRLQRSHRRTLGMRITEDGLAVSAPFWITRGQVEHVLLSRAGWILRKLREHYLAARSAAQPVLWQHGMQLQLLGQPMRILLDAQSTAGQKLPPARAQARLAALAHWEEGDAGASPSLTLSLPPQATAADMRRVTLAWFRQQALRHFEQRVAVYAPLLDVRCSALHLSNARTRWGSANARGVIRLHWGLLHFPSAVLDYVVVHELCHLREMNHSPRFWALVEQLMPDYREQRQWLSGARLPQW
ncbi:M48 family metallopeptidase [Brachymonas chironomi]|uniref:M48 family metallopeptidase n=1 Tax=Brachymonas chironomi TaxID=491919 RepID=UPI00037BCE8D|nr:SprT family zinc-dependent metalloprotease [Brachymonas chironomi]